jgi:hypothetical protein
MNSFIEQAAGRNSSSAVIKNALASGELKSGMSFEEVTAVLDSSKNAVSAAGQATELISNVGDEGKTAIGLAVPAESVAAASKVVQDTAQTIGEKLGADVMKNIDPDKLAKYIAHNMEQPGFLDKLAGTSKLEKFQAMADKVVEKVVKDGELPEYLLNQEGLAAASAQAANDMAM